MFLNDRSLTNQKDGLSNQLNLTNQDFYVRLVDENKENNRPLSRNAETKDFARLTSHPVLGWTYTNKAFCSPGTQNGRCVIKVYCFLCFFSSTRRT